MANKKITNEQDTTQELKKLFQKDQEERENWKEWGETVPIEEVCKRDTQRLKRVLTLIEQETLVEGQDFYHAAMVLQHSSKAKHYKLANELCTKAIELGEKRAKWLYAATLDRYLLNSGKKYQKFGTQYQKENGKWVLCPIDPSTTDSDREQYNVPVLKKLQDRVIDLNS